HARRAHPRRTGARAGPVEADGAVLLRWTVRLRPHRRAQPAYDRVGRARHESHSGAPRSAAGGRPHRAGCVIPKSLPSGGTRGWSPVSLLREALGKSVAQATKQTAPACASAAEFKARFGQPLWPVPSAMRGLLGESPVPGLSTMTGAPIFTRL